MDDGRSFPRASVGIRKMTDPKNFSVDGMFKRSESRARKDLANFERRGLSAGKEPFDIAKLEELMHAAPGSRAEEAEDLRSQYFIRFQAVRTLEEFAEKVLEADAWDGRFN